MKAKQILPEMFDPVAAFGVHDSNLRLIENNLQVKIYPVRGEFVIEGKKESVLKASGILESILHLSKNGQPVSQNEIRLLLDKDRNPHHAGNGNLKLDGLPVSRKGHRIKPRTLNQADYLQRMLQNDLVFAIGPAGTGKTYLAVGMALHLLNTGRVKKVILTRPVVEAGENLGFLPGTLEEKIDPYLKPLFDAIYEMLSPEELKSYFESRTIELAPLAYMRGRTLANAFVILDEGQNTTPTQMKMFLTRLGENSKMVVTGDITQIDLPSGNESGLKQAIELFSRLSGVHITCFEKEDIVRHGLVKKIVESYEKIGK